MADTTPAVTPRARVTPGSVQVSVRLRQSAEQVWPALWDPVRLGAWFGDLDRPWLVGRRSRVEFGDGDFFDLTPVAVVEGERIEFEWSFLGVGPTQLIRWTVHPAPDGADVVVTDHDADRPPAESDQMVAGWTDFLGRLARYLATGEPSRYEWREDLDGSVNLADPSVQPLRLDTLYRWLPVSSDGFTPRWFFVVDDEGPRRFTVGDWHLPNTHELTFTVEIPGAVAPTYCAVSVDSVEETTRLRFSHTGWRALGLPGGRGPALRRRFAKTWIAALGTVRDMAAPAAAPGGRSR